MYDGLDDAIQILVKFGVPEAFHDKPLRSEPHISNSISLGVFSLCVLVAVQFYDDTRTVAGEIDNVLADNDLPSESETLGFQQPQFYPKPAFVLCHVLA